VIPEIVTFHDVWPPDPELAGAVHRQRLAGLWVDDLSLGAWRQQPSRAVPAALLGRVRGRADSRALCQPVPLKDLHLRVFLLKPLDQLLAERRSAGEHLAQAPKRQAVGVRQHGDEDGRHEWEVGDPVFVDGAQHLGELVLGEHDDGGAAAEQPRGEGDEAVDVEHGHRAEEGLGPVGGLEAEARHDDLHHGDEAPVRGDDALAGARGARGVEQRGRVVLRDAVPAARGVGRRGGDLPDGGDDGARVGGEAVGLEEDDADAGAGAGARELGEEVAGGEGDDGARVGDLLGDLGGRVERVGGGEDGAEGHGCEGGNGEVDGVRGEDERDLALAERQRRRGERGGRPFHRAPEFLERDPVARGGVDERDDARVAAGREEPDDVQVRVGGERDVRALATEGARRGAVAAARVRPGRHRDRIARAVVLDTREGGRGIACLASPGAPPLRPSRACECVLRRRSAGRFFLHFGPSSEKNSRLDSKNFNVIFGPFTRRRSLWRRGNTARRHRLWRRGTCCVGTNGRRGADLVPSSAP
jgi:hypothetical protein